MDRNHFSNLSFPQPKETKKNPKTIMFISFDISQASLFYIIQ